MLVVFDVTSLPSGDLAIGGTDEYLGSEVVLSSERIEGKAVSLLLRGGGRIETHAVGIAVHTALSGHRNVYLRIPRVAHPDSLRGARGDS
jgi:hypothetical protein